MTIVNAEELVNITNKAKSLALKEFAQFGNTVTLWYQKNHRLLPWRELWKKYKSPYHVWVSEIMLQQTTIAVVLPKYEEFLKKYRSLYDLARSNEEDIKKTVRGLGYYRRFSYLHKAALQLTDNASKQTINWPTNFDSWKKIPGVGDYTAAAISSIAFNCPEVVVDGNVERLFSRIFDIRLPTNVNGLKKTLRTFGNLIISKDFPGDFNQGLMELGQTICIQGLPRCQLCPIKKWCKAFKNKSIALAPAPKQKSEKIEINMRLLICRKGSKVALMKRPKKAQFLKDTYGFATDLKQGKRYIYDGSPRPFKLLKSSVLGQISHSITKYRLKVQVFQCSLDYFHDKNTIKWLCPTDVEKQLISNLDRKAWNMYLQECIEVTRA